MYTREMIYNMKPLHPMGKYRFISIGIKSFTRMLEDLIMADLRRS